MALLVLKRFPIRIRTSLALREFCVDSDMLRGFFRIGLRSVFINSFSTNVGIETERLCWESSTQTVLSKKLETALQCRRVDEAWESFWDYRKLYGFPDVSIVDSLIAELSCSSDPRWLRKARGLVMSISREKSGLLSRESLMKLSLSLARAQLANQTMEVLRLMLEKDALPCIGVLRAVVLHLVKSEVGTILVSNFLVQTCESFLRMVSKMRPDTVVFNLVLGACVRFELGFKGEEVVESMAKLGVVCDAHSIVIICRIHEMNGQRDEIRKYKEYIEKVSHRFLCHYCQFYDCLLSLHFKFSDIDAASELVRQICSYRESVSTERNRQNLPKGFLVPIGSHNLRDGLKMQIQPELLERDTVLKVETKQEFIKFRNGKLVLSNNGLAKLVRRFKRVGNVGELSKLLLVVQKELCSLRGSNLCSDVIEASVRLGWLEFAHDILDDTEASGASVDCYTYMLLLASYLKGKMLREAKSLLNQMRKPGMTDKMVITEYLSCVNSTSKTGLIDAFVQEMRNEKNLVPSMVYELNSSIRFFCKANMIEDAMRTYRRMRERNIDPTTETFANLVFGFSSLKMYREITILWGDMKRNMECGNLCANRDLYERLVMSFLRGGYFERVMEVIEHMDKYAMFRDKSMYKSEFLKLHKNLYRSLKASEARTDAQRDRLRYVLSFRKWAGID